ncbi:MAG TPA: LptA/OstA family protein [Permianibacter sp.]|nr:LptA/OstA family protein [Permianibacter sp.]
MKTLVKLLALLPLATQAAGGTDLQADSATLDGKTGEYLYRGNALLRDNNVQINADEMQATQDADGNLQSGRFRGSPAVLVHIDPATGTRSETRANEILYDSRAGRIELLGNAILVQTEADQNRQMRLQAERIELIERSEKISDLTATGAPVMFSRQQTDALPLEGRANSLRYQGEREFLVLEGDAVLQQGPTQFEHVVIEYDGRSKRITAPKRDGKQVKITRVQSSEGGAGNSPQPGQTEPATTEKPATDITPETKKNPDTNTRPDAETRKEPS